MLSFGRASPTDAAHILWGSLVWFLEYMVNSIWPGLMSLSPSFLEISLAFGGNMLEIKTRLVPAMPASLRAYSKLVSLSV